VRVAEDPRVAAGLPVAGDAAFVDSHPDTAPVQCIGRREANNPGPHNGNISSAEHPYNLTAVDRRQWRSHELPTRGTTIRQGRAIGRLDGKTALITGGSGSIGLATARAFLAEGAEVMIVDRDEDALARAEAALRSERLAAKTVDVTSEEQVQAAVADTVQRFGKLDIAFANAGVFGEVAPVSEYPVDVFTKVMMVNVVGSFLVVKHALTAMGAGGSVVINSSVVGLTSDRGIAGYATSKHAVVGLMRTAAKEVAADGIRVNTIHPGPTDNDFQHAIEVEAIGASREESAKVFDQMIPLDRHASPDEIAKAVLFLASDDSSFMTGATMAVDGGLSI
jgi:NAD(P)-dependent dehydrogenase (short-subunit alcohol dehydrogenase family)